MDPSKCHILIQFLQAFLFILKWIENSTIAPWCNICLIMNESFALNPQDRRREKEGYDTFVLLPTKEGEPGKSRLKENMLIYFVH